MFYTLKRIELNTLFIVGCCNDFYEPFDFIPRDFLDVRTDACFLSRKMDVSSVN
jgi:hypothetical protein